MKTEFSPKPQDQRTATTRLQLRYRDGRFEVCNQTTNEIEGHVLAHPHSLIESYVFVARKTYSKYPGKSIREALAAYYGANISYTIEPIL
jgi:hypothetical protein